MEKEENQKVENKSENEFGNGSKTVSNETQSKTKEESTTKETEKSPEEKMRALSYQKYYTGGAIVLMFLVLIAMYFVLR